MGSHLARINKGTQTCEHTVLKYEESTNYTSYQVVAGNYSPQEADPIARKHRELSLELPVDFPSTKI